MKKDNGSPKETFDSHRTEVLGLLLKEHIQLRRALLPYLEIKNQVIESIDFEQALRNKKLSAGTRSMLLLIRVIWESTQQSDLIALASKMEISQRRLLLKALKIFWVEHEN